MNSPLELPRLITSRKFHVEAGKFVSLRVKPEVMTTDKQLFDLSSRKRLCYFQSENPLMIHKHYNQVNCEHECRILFLQDKCKCLFFNLPVGMFDTLFTFYRLVFINTFMYLVLISARDIIF